MQVAGCEVLASEVEDVKQGSALHRWIVLDAIESAESVPQDEIGKAAIETARVWVAAGFPTNEPINQQENE